MKIRPLHDRVVVRRSEEEQRTPGGLVIPDTAKEKPSRGEIISIGEGKRKEDGSFIPLSVKVKDQVLFGKYAGTEVEVGGEKLIVMREDDIMGVIEN